MPTAGTPAWLWDVDFASLSDVAVVSGTRADDMALRLHYDNIEVEHVEGALPAALDTFLAIDGPKRMWHLHSDDGHSKRPRLEVQPGGYPMTANSGKPLKIVHLYPEQMNIYGDTGNVLTIVRRAQWHGYDPEVVVHHPGTPFPQDVDLIVGGGGQDSGQGLVTDDLLALGDHLPRPRR